MQFCQSFLPAAPPVEPFLYQQVNISNISHFGAHALVNVQMQGRSIVNYVLAIGTRAKGCDSGKVHLVGLQVFLP